MAALRCWLDRLALGSHMMLYLSFIGRPTQKSHVHVPVTIYPLAKICLNFGLLGNHRCARKDDLRHIFGENYESNM